jgi:hypothetical protein
MGQVHLYTEIVNRDKNARLQYMINTIHTDDKQRHHISHLQLVFH